ncbi:MAG: aminopeptidase P family protein [Kiritimatiellales bacterium]|nr:aminopeptidase P family protein [Kiritimatiellales bacterium]
MEKGRAIKQSPPGTEVFTSGELGLRRKSGAKLASQAIALIEKAGLRRVQAPADFPVGLFQALEKKGIRIAVLKTPACPERIVKSSSEIALIRQSQQAAVAAIQIATALIHSAKIGKNNQLMLNGKVLTSEIVREHVSQELIRHECSANDTIIAGGVQGTDCHERGSGPLYAGQSIIMDIFPRSEIHGYWGDITRSVCRGPASPGLKKMYNTVKTAQQTALAMVKPGVCTDEIHQAVQAVFEKRGYETKAVEGRHVGFVHGTGHGVGLDIHESPRIGRSGEMLAAGNVVTVEPGLYYPELGGIRIEDTIVVTEKGWRYLAPCAKRFELL